MASLKKELPELRKILVLRVRRIQTSRVPPWAKVALSLFGLTVFYVVTAVGNRSETDDAFGYAQAIEHGPLRELVGPQSARHLLFLPLFRGLYLALRWTGLHARAYDEVRFVSAVIAACAVTLMAFLLRRRFGLSKLTSLAGAAGLAVSYGFWRYANEAEVYSIAILLMLLICWIAFADGVSTRASMAAGAVAALAVLIDAEVAVTAFVAVPIAFLLRRRFRRLAVYCMVLILLLAVFTLALYRYSHPQGKTFVSYILGASAPERHGLTGKYSPSTAPSSLIAFGQTVTAGNFLFAYPSIAQRLREALPNRRVALAYAAERASPAVRLLAPILLAALLFVTVSLLLSLRSQPRRRLDAKLIGVASWFVSLGVVLAGRNSNPEAWILELPAIWILIAALLFELIGSQTRRRIIILVPLCLLAFNAVSGWIMRSKAYDLNVLKAQWLLSNAGVGDAVLTADNGKFGLYLQYYSRANVQCLEGRTASQLRHLYERVLHDARHLYITGDIFNPPRSPYLDAKRRRRIVNFGASIRPSLEKIIDDEFGGIYVPGTARSSRLKGSNLPTEVACF